MEKYAKEVSIGNLFRYKASLPIVDFAVVLAWDTESDEGINPILVGVKAKTSVEALGIAVKKAVQGNLYPILYTGESKTPMVIVVEQSFACKKSELTFIN